MNVLFPFLAAMASSCLVTTKNCQTLDLHLRNPWRPVFSLAFLTSLLNSSSYFLSTYTQLPEIPQNQTLFQNEVKVRLISHILCRWKRQSVQTIRRINILTIDRSVLELSLLLCEFLVWQLSNIKINLAVSGNQDV